MSAKHLLKSLQDAGITITEAAKLLPVSRATLHNWKSGTTKGDPLRLQVVTGYAKLIDTAVATGRLPLPVDTPAKERVAVLRRILAETKRNR